MRYGEQDGPLAIAHRGGAGLAQENSMLAFGLASGLGLRYLETDLRVTSDGHLVCFHDETLQRVTRATAPVRWKSLGELRALRINGTEPIPTFDEALDTFPNQCFTVDPKDQAGLGPLVKSLKRRGVAQRVCLAGAWDGLLAQVHREVPEVTTALGWRSLTALLMCARTGVRPPRGHGGVGLAIADGLVDVRARGRPPAQGLGHRTLRARAGQARLLPDLRRAACRDVARHRHTGCDVDRGRAAGHAASARRRGGCDHHRPPRRPARGARLTRPVGADGFRPRGAMQR